MVVLPGHWVKQDSEAVSGLREKRCPLIIKVATGVGRGSASYLHSCSRPTLLYKLRPRWVIICPGPPSKSAQSQTTAQSLDPQDSLLQLHQKLSMGMRGMCQPGGRGRDPPPLPSPSYTMRKRAPALPLASEWLGSSLLQSPQMPRLRPSRLQTTTSRTTEHSRQPTIHLPQRRWDVTERAVVGTGGAGGGPSGWVGPLPQGRGFRSVTSHRVPRLRSPGHTAKVGTQRPNERGGLA